MADSSQNQPQTTATPQTGDTREGFIFALSAYILWGFLPFYMKAVAHIPPWEIVAHRIIWSIPLAGLIIYLLKRTADLKRVLREPKTLLQAGFCAIVLTFNWGVYVWAIVNDRAIEAALGYYINPLFSIFLAYVFLKEELDRLQWTAIVLAVIAVIILSVGAGGVPLLALALTFSWGIYAFFKKTLPVGPTQGFFLEVMLLSVPALGFIIYLVATGQSNFGASETHSASYNIVLLLFSGVVTAVPLILYANGAKLLRLSTIGIMQYIAPTMIFLIAVFVFGEPFGTYRAVAFVFIWCALALYSVSLLRTRNAAKKAAKIRAATL